MPTCNGLYFFRKCLRLHDNRALVQLSQSVTSLLPVFIVDPAFVQPAKNATPGGSGVGRVGKLPFNFLLESLKDLDESLQKHGSRLFVFRGKTEDVIRHLVSELKKSDMNGKEEAAVKLAFELDTEPFARERDARVRQIAAKNNVEVITAIGHTLFDLDALAGEVKGEDKAVTQYKTFLKLISGKDVPKPVEAPKKLPVLPKAFTSDETICKHRVPSLTDLNFEELSAEDNPIVRGGESLALARLADQLSDEAFIAGFKKPQTAPTDFEPAATTVLSPYITFGCLSVRKFYHDLNKIYSKRSHSKPPESLHGQLFFRELFYYNSLHVPNYDQMKGNPVCKQLPWGDEKVHKERLQAWKDARTGYPWIDAAMTQLRTQGWIHHLARHAVACFLTRGDLWVSWEEGRDVFAEYLLDGDWALNASNWMWLSASAYFSQYFRVYSPISFPQKTDKDGAYVRHFLPQLKAFPKKYIYEPWKAPLDVQREANCIIGQDYPEPIVEHSKAKDECMALMKEAFADNKGKERKPVKRRRLQ